MILIAVDVPDCVPFLGSQLFRWSAISRLVVAQQPPGLSSAWRNTESPVAVGIARGDIADAGQG